MRFTNPFALPLLILLPLLWILAWPRRKTFILLRSALIICLLLALAGLEFVSPGRRVAAVFLLDQSDSISPSARATVNNYVRQALSALDQQDLAAVAVFGAEARVERPPSASQEFPDPSTSVQTYATDISAAIRLGLALLPGGRTPRLIILSDGAANTGDTAAALRLAQASGVQIFSVPLASNAGPEVLVRDLNTPTRLYPGERYSLGITLQSNIATKARLRLYVGSQLAYESEITMIRGVQAFSLPLVAPNSGSGYLRYQVQIEPLLDTAYQNNQLSGFALLQGSPQALIVAPVPGETLPGGESRPDEAAALFQVLQAAGYQTQQLSPERLPSEALALGSYALVVLVDVPARQFSPRQMSALQSYVRDLGGGLLAIGGPTSYGIGGYFRTPLEDLLPLNMQIQDPLRRPGVTIVFVVDRSGSMSDASGGATRLQLAQEAAIRSLDLLFPGDRVGVVSFDESASWTVPIQDIENISAIRAAILGLSAGGGTDILAGVQAASTEIIRDPAQVRHILLLTDGGADPSGIPELVKHLYNDQGITLSSVGIGPGAAPFLPELAQAGGGRYYAAPDPSAIPSIFTEEISLAARSYLEEHTFTPVLVYNSPVFSGLSGGATPAFPTLDGYVATSAKPTAQVLLTTDLDDPLLAIWQYGLGRSAAFTSDTTGRWASRWLAWEGFPRLWTQLAEGLQQNLAQSPLDVHLEQDTSGARLLVDARTPEGTFINGYDFLARIIGPDGVSSEMRLTQEAPGQYAAPLNLSTSEGVYLYAITGAPSPNAVATSAIGTLAASGGWSLGYSPEYTLTNPDPEALCSLDREPDQCRATYRCLEDPNPGACRAQIYCELANLDECPTNLPEHNTPEQVFNDSVPISATFQPLWPVLLALATLLLPLDIAARRLYLPAEEIRGLLQRIVPSRRRAQVPQPASSDALTALRAARQKRTSSPVIPPASPTPSSQAQPGPTPPNLSDPLTPTEPNKVKTSTTSVLLAAKRRRQTQPDENSPPGGSSNNGG